jgi:hypothetical protein
MAVFPYLGTYGNIDEASHAENRILRRYPNGAKRQYVISTFEYRRLTLQFRAFSQAKRDAIRAFVRARWADNANFTVYNPQETFVLDLTGVATLGKHTADEIVGNVDSWTQDSNCRYTGSLTFFLID